MFAGKVRAYPIEAPVRCFTLGQATDLANKPKTILDRLARDKHSSLLQKYVNYGQKSFMKSTHQV
jgi:hypothetical protein